MLMFLPYSCLVSHIQSLVFGGVDGIITSFAVVAAIAGAGYSTFYILAIGIANLIADGLSMGNVPGIYRRCISVFSI